MEDKPRVEADRADRPPGEDGGEEPADGPRPGRAAFEEEALPHLDAVYRFALRLAGSPDAAEDLVQETFLRAYRSWEQYTPGTRCKSWLFTICRNVFLRQRERGQRHEGLDALRHRCEFAFVCPLIVTTSHLLRHRVQKLLDCHIPRLGVGRQQLAQPRQNP